MNVLKRIFIYLFILGGLAYAAYFISTGIFLPLYADELGGYGAAIRHQVENGISLSPNATPYKYTFGHPQMHTVVMTPLAHLFGFQPFGLHMSSFVLSMFGLSLLAYYLGKRFKLSTLQITLMVALLMVQPILLAQSYMVHSEMLLLLLMGLAILLAWHKQFLMAAIITCFAVLTKETGMYLVCLLPCVAYDQYRKNDLSLQKLFLSIGYLVLPVITFLIFIWVQNKQMGFYLSPTNMGKTTSSLDGVYHKFIGTLRFVFLAQNRFVLTSMVLVLTVAKKSGGLEILKKSLFLILSFCLASSILSHPIERYLMFPVTVWVLTIGLIIVRLKLQSKMIWSLALLALVFNVLEWDVFRSKTISDSDLTYRQSIANTQHALAYINEHKTSPVVLEFPYNFSQEYSHSGYSRLSGDIQILRSPPKDTAHYRMFSNPGNLEHENDTLGYNLVVRINYPYSFSELRFKD